MSKAPYASTVGSLMYVMLCTRLDIAHIVGVVGKYMNHPIIELWIVVKWILIYLRGTSNKCLNFGGSTTNLKGYVGSNLAKDIDTKWSTTRYVFSVVGVAMR